MGAVVSEHADSAARAASDANTVKAFGARKLRMGSPSGTGLTARGSSPIQGDRHRCRYSHRPVLDYTASTSASRKPAPSPGQSLSPALRSVTCCVVATTCSAEATILHNIFKPGAFVAADQPVMHLAKAQWLVTADRMTECCDRAETLRPAAIGICKSLTKKTRRDSLVFASCGMHQYVPARLQPATGSTHSPCGRLVSFLGAGASPTATEMGSNTSAPSGRNFTQSFRPIRLRTSHQSIWHCPPLPWR